MPSRHRIKTYAENSYYHVYNRGVEKRNIFLEDMDYAVLLSYLKTYLMPKDSIALQSVLLNPDTGWKEKDEAKRLLRMNNFHESVELICYCLMKNHYHMLIRQSEATAIDIFMNSLWTRYAMYFNKKYKRVGPLFQGVYNAVLVETDEQLMHLTRYIHRNPIAKRQFRNPASKGEALRSYFYSSYQDYIGQRHTAWIHPGIILSHWNTHQFGSYEDFVLEASFEEQSAKIIAPVII